MIESIEVLRVPAGLVVPVAMQAAQERLLTRLQPENPPEVRHLQSVVKNERSALLFALLGVPQEVNWQELPAEQYIGTLTLVGLETTTRCIGYIDHVVVDERYEGRGIGEKLVRKAIEVGKALGVSRLDLTTNASKSVAQRLYEKTGFRRRDTNNWRFDF